MKANEKDHFQQAGQHYYSLLTRITREMRRRIAANRQSQQTAALKKAA
ncbi:MAG: hypothetical protein KYX62_11515 [Pseudomonadota bacterium]|nr:hypothetical protein [Pseudomonadota bacterium]